METSKRDTSDDATNEKCRDREGRRRSFRGYQHEMSFVKTQKKSDFSILMRKARVRVQKKFKAMREQNSEERESEELRGEEKDVFRRMFIVRYIPEGKI